MPTKLVEWSEDRSWLGNGRRLTAGLGGSAPAGVAGRLLVVLGVLAMAFAGDVLGQEGVPYNLNIPATTISSGSAAYEALNTITTNGNFVVGPAANVLFQVLFPPNGSIVLMPGFKATANYTSPSFQAIIGPALSPQATITGTQQVNTAQTISFAFQDPHGAQNIAGGDVTFLLLDNLGNVTNQCPVEVRGGSVILRDTGTTSNGTCTVNWSTFVVGSEVITVGLNITFKVLGVYSINSDVIDTIGLLYPFETLGEWIVSPAVSTLVTETITSSPVGLSVTVDGSSCTTPCYPQWAAGQPHTIAASSQNASGATYTFSSWNIGGPASQTVIASSTGATYIANFGAQYMLTTSVSPAGAGTVNPSGAGWYNAGQVVSIAASANSGYSFTGFSGGLGGTVSPQSVTMNGPQNVVANFGTVGVVTQFSISVTSAVSVSIKTGGAAVLSAMVVPLAGAAPQTVVLVAPAGVPSGMTATLSSSSVQVGSAPVSFTINLSAGTAQIGSYPLTISGQSGGATASATLPVTIGTLDVMCYADALLVGLDDGQVYPYFAAYVTGADAGLVTSQFVGGVNAYGPGGAGGSQAASSLLESGSTPTTVSLAPFSMANSHFGVYTFGYEVQFMSSGSEVCGGGQVVHNAVNYPIPSATSISPNFAAPGATTSVTVTGSGLGAPSIGGLPEDLAASYYAGVTAASLPGSGASVSIGSRPVTMGQPTGTYLPLSITVPSNATPGAYSLSLTSLGYAISGGPTFYVDEPSPQISSIVFADPSNPLVPGWQSYISIYGQNLGGSGTVVVCQYGAPPDCSGAGDVAVVAGSYWFGNYQSGYGNTQVNVELSAGPNAAGLYYIFVISNGANGISFMQAPRGTANQSNGGAVNVSPVLITQTAPDGTTHNVTGKTQPIVVGQQVNLTATLTQSGAAIQSQSWSVGGNPIGSYQIGPTMGKSTSFSDPGTNNAVFYWIASGANAVMYTVTLTNGTKYTAMTTFGVTSPNLFAYASVAGAYVVDVAKNQLSFGAPGAPGMTFNADVVPGAAEAGSLNFLQTINVNRTVTDGSGKVHTKSSGGCCVLDKLPDETTAFYADQPPSAMPASLETLPDTNDSPSASFISTDEHVSVGDSYYMYLMYQPNGANSIWVVLGVLNWPLSAGATNNAGTWSVDPNSIVPPNPKGSASTSLPQWSQNAAQLNFN